MKVAFMTSSGIDSQFQKINVQTEKLGMKLPGTTRDFTIMAARLKELGIASKTIANGGLEGSAFLRVLLGNVSPEGVADITATFSKSLGIAEKDFVKFIDQIQRAKFGFGLDPEQFAYTLKYVGPIFKQLGISGYNQSKSVLALSGALSQAGIKGEQLGTSLRGIMLNIPSLDDKLETKKMKEVNEQLKTTGIHLEFFKNGNFLGIENMIKQVEKLNKLNSQDKLNTIKKLFGDESATAISEMATQGLKGYQKAQQTLEKQASLQKRLNEITATFKNLWEAATGTLENTFAKFGSTISPELKAFATYFNTMSENIGKFVDKHPLLAKNIALTTLALSGGLVVFGTLSIAVGGACLMFANLTAGYGKFLSLARTLSPILNSNAINLAKMMKFNWTASFLKNPDQTFGGAMPYMKRYSNLWTNLGIDIKQADNRMKSYIVNNVKAFPANFKNSITQAATAMKELAKTQLLNFRTNFLTVSGLKNIGNALKSNFLTGIKSAITAVRAFSLTLLTSPIGWISLAIAGAALLIYKYWKPITGFFKGVFKGLKEGLAPLKPAFNSLAKALSPVITPLKAIWEWFKKLIQPVNDTGGAAEKMGVKFGKVLAQIILKVTDLIKKMFQLGAKIADFLSFGMLSKTGQTQKAIGKHAQLIRDHLPHSPAKIGPLKDLHKVKLIETIAGTLKPAPLNTAMNKALTFKPKKISMNGASNNNGGSIAIHYNPNISISDASPTAKDDFAKMLHQHKGEIEKIIKNAQQKQARLAY
jgi:TP901 family phage tail tape measure protein